jgi:hypothetical protein
VVFGGEPTELAELSYTQPFTSAGVRYNESIADRSLYFAIMLDRSEPKVDF